MSSTRAISSAAYSLGSSWPRFRRREKSIGSRAHEENLTTLKHWLLGTAYATIHRLLSGEIRIDPREVPTRVFEELNHDRPNGARVVAAAAYWTKAELHYRARRALSISEHYDVPVEFYRLFLDATTGPIAAPSGTTSTLRSRPRNAASSKC